MFIKLFLIALFLIFSNQSFAFIEYGYSCDSSLFALIPEKSTFIMLLLSVLLVVLIRCISILVKKLFGRSKEWMVFLFLYFLYFSIDYYLFSTKESVSFLEVHASLFTLAREYLQSFLPLYTDLIVLLSVLYIYIVSVVSDMPIVKKVWVNWKIKIFFILILIIGHVVGYRIAYLEQCTEHYLGISPLLGYNVTFIFISILISLLKRVNTLLMVAFSGALYNLLLLIDYFASRMIERSSFISDYGGYIVVATLFAIYTLYFSLILFCTRKVKEE